MTDNERKEYLERSRKEIAETFGIEVDVQSIDLKPGEDPTQVLIKVFKDLADTYKRELVMSMLSTLNMNNVQVTVQMVVMGEVYSAMAHTFAHHLGRTIGILRSALDIQISSDESSNEEKENAIAALLEVNAAVGSFHNYIDRALHQGLDQGKREADIIAERARSGK